MVQTNYIENSLKIQSKDLANHGAKRNYMEKKRRSHHHKRFWNVSTLCFLLESTSIELQGPFLHPKSVTLFHLNQPPFIVQEKGKKWAKTASSSPPARSGSPTRTFQTAQFACARSGSLARDLVRLRGILRELSRQSSWLREIWFACAKSYANFPDSH
ncbi:hypothetical protein QL285_072590 [Trifolium repens]|nr:hypothetical protein QL285_072590 [Trifolium repens]